MAVSNGTRPAGSLPPGLAIIAEADLAEVEQGSFLGGTVGIFSSPSPDRDGDPNEDAAAVIPFDRWSGALVVADGCGGLPNGGQASRVVVDAIAAELGSARENEQPLRLAVIDGIQRANREVAALGAGAGSTVSVITIERGIVRSYHVGDSMVLVTGQRGRIKLQTIAHSPVGYAVESGLLDEDEAIDHVERHIVSNLVGFDDMRIEIGPAIRLAPRDTLVIASDGLSDNMLVGEIVERVRKGSVPDAIDALVGLCRCRMAADQADVPHKPDDLTILLYRPGR